MRHERVRLYSVFERTWHWTQAACVVVLAATGLELRGHVRVLGFADAAGLHEATGFLLLASAFLGLFGFLTTGAIRQYVAPAGGFLAGARAQVRYYLRGIFHGARHPAARTPQQRLNPLQQVTYVLLLNVLLPLQILTGMALWGADRLPGARALLVEPVPGGLPVIAAAHALGAWLFVAFLVMHVYLATTSGRRPLSGIRAMVTGWETRHVGVSGPVAPREEVTR